MRWKEIDNITHFGEILERSRSKPALIFKHRSRSIESSDVKNKLESEWIFDDKQLDAFLVDESTNREVSEQVTEAAGVEEEYPQVLLFADGVTMYDESHELISIKKIKIALKIINRTFKWMETRV